MRYWILAILGLISLAVHAMPLPRISAVPGGIVQIPIASASPTQPMVYYKDKRVAVIPNPSKQKKYHWLAVVGIPLETPAGKQTLIIKAPLYKQQLFYTRNKDYQTQKIMLSSAQFKQFQTSLQLDQQKFQRLYQHFSNTVPFNNIWKLPVQGKISSQFGVKREINNTKDPDHNGVDIAAKLDSPVKSPAPGVVLATLKMVAAGNTIILDHGQGLITVYSHLKDITVKKGQHVALNQIMGHVGQSGRVTGAHLHWSVILNQTAVNPLLFLPVQ